MGTTDSHKYSDIYIYCSPRDSTVSKKKKTSEWIDLIRMRSITRKESTIMHVKKNLVARFWNDRQDVVRFDLQLTTLRGLIGCF